MEDKAIQTYVLNIAEEFGCRNSDTTAKVQSWDKLVMENMLDKKIAKLRSEQSKHKNGSAEHHFIETQIESIEEVRTGIKKRK